MADSLRDELDEFIDAELGRGFYLSFKERRMLQERDYAGLLRFVDGYIRNMKWMTWFFPSLLCAQALGHGLIILRGMIEEGRLESLLWGLPIYVGVAVLFVALFLVFLIPRLVRLERVRLAMQLLIGVTAPDEAPAPILDKA